MSATLRVLRAELHRLARVRSNWLVLFLLAASAALGAFVAVGSALAERTGAEDPLTSGKAWVPFVDGWRAGLVLGALLLLASAARGLASDRESGLLRLGVTRSATRRAFVLARVLLSPLLVLLVVSSTGLAAWAVAGANGDFGPLVEDGYEIFTAAELRAEIMRGILAVLPALLATQAFGLCVSSLVRSPALAVSAALGIFLGFDLFKETLGPSRAVIFASHVPTLADTSAWSELPGVMRGFSDAGFSAGLFQAALVWPWPAVVLFTSVACLALSRKAL